MCGILGLLLDADLPIPADAVREASSRLRHRGPDDDGWLAWGRDGARSGHGDPPDLDARALFAHRRLSILDLTAAGRQPMSGRDGRYHLVFNGEIYNYVELRAELEALGHRFASRSDTEVLLEALARWGEAALPRLVGMFALALLDTAERRVLLARDFAGMKPLYYAAWRDGLAFASEIKALLALPGVSRRADANAVRTFLLEGTADAGDRTLFADVRPFPPASFAWVALDHPRDVRFRPYWRPDLGRTLDVSGPEAAALFRDAVLRSVEQHLRSDVPVGTALSGGLDSSTLVMCMRRLRPGLDLHSFTYVSDDGATGEERWADVVTGAAGATVHKCRPTPGEMLDELDDVAWLQDQPFSGTSVYAQHRVFRLAREHGIKVLLDGQGADELLGGYYGFWIARAADLVGEGRVVQAEALARAIARWMGGSEVAVARRVAVELGRRTRLGGVLRPAFRALLHREWLDTDWFRARCGAAERPAPRPRSFRELSVHCLTRSTLPDYLRFEDRNSMGASVESRLPFLTPGLAQLALSLPPGLLVDERAGHKAVLREAMRDVVPAPVLDRRDKVGFATPETAWLRAQAPRLADLLSGEGARRLPFLRAAGMDRVRGTLRAGGLPDGVPTWWIVSLCRWADRFGAEFE